MKDRIINKILAEHVFEHLTARDLSLVLGNFYKYSTEDVNIRIAVPDGNHPDPDYIQLVKPEGKGKDSRDHKFLFDYNTLTEAFKNYGFKPKLIEYWDENGNFYSGYTNDDKGFIKRSFINDSRNNNGKPTYTSLIVDFFKDKYNEPLAKV